MIQLNNYPGFGNFQDYQKRKIIFIKKDSVNEKLLVNLAINNSINGQGVTYLEARITPSSSLNENVQQIKILDKLVQSQDLNTPFAIDERPSENEYNYHYIYHFIKSDVNSRRSYVEKLIELVSPRNFALRRKVKEQAMAINLLRRQISDVKDRIVGVDAASSEIGFRPEIFAQAFRYLKKYSCELKNHFLKGESSLNVLGFTYHVGEDFLDIADGLRAIDETIRFLNFRRGDRLGHYLALGVPPQDYYTRRRMRILLPKQDHLDNVVWLLIHIRPYNISTSQSLILELNERYWELFRDIYQEDISEKYISLIPPKFIISHGYYGEMIR